MMFSLGMVFVGVALLAGMPPKGAVCCGGLFGIAVSFAVLAVESVRKIYAFCKRGGDRIGRPNRKASPGSR